MTKINPNDFPLKTILDGTEEVYTQTNGVSEKFLLSDICNFCTGDIIENTTIEAGDGVEIVVTGHQTIISVQNETGGGIRSNNNGLSIGWGLGANDVNASNIPINDSLDYYIGNTVEDAFEELGKNIKGLDVHFQEFKASEDISVRQSETIWGVPASMNNMVLQDIKTRVGTIGMDNVELEIILDGNSIPITLIAGNEIENMVGVGQQVGEDAKLEINVISVGLNPPKGLSVILTFYNDM